MCAPYLRYLIRGKSWFIIIIYHLLHVFFILYLLTSPKHEDAYLCCVIQDIDGDPRELWSRTDIFVQESSPNIILQPKSKELKLGDEASF